MSIYSRKRGYFIFLVVLCQLLSACSFFGGSLNHQNDRYSLSQDIAPKGDFDTSSIPDTVPKWEPLSKQGNMSPYTVRGEEYEVLSSTRGYVEEGIASWYGLKFHGELTSNGETYNIYALSAAHKTLPLPTYLRVTNLENNKSIVVRVNDRGPFHPDRVVDLSYAAAKKLGYQKQGTARVRLEAINIPHNLEGEENSSQEDKLANYIQVAAFSNLSSAENLKAKVQNYSVDHPVFVAKSKGHKVIYRVRVGPFQSIMTANEVIDQLHEAHLGHAILITRSIRAKEI